MAARMGMTLSVTALSSRRPKNRHFAVGASKCYVGYWMKPLTSTIHLFPRLAHGVLLLATLAFLTGTFLTFATGRVSVIDVFEAGPSDALHMHADGIVHAHAPVQQAGTVPDDTQDIPGDHQHEKPPCATFASAPLPSFSEGPAVRLQPLDKLAMTDSRPMVDAARGHPERPPRTETL
jgi:hypothetical protein